MADRYKERLRGELDGIIRQRINARRTLERIANGFRRGDELDTRHLGEFAQRTLRGTQARYEELHHLLGIERRLGPPVRLRR